MRKGIINVNHVHINLNDDLLYIGDVLAGSFSDFKSKTMHNHRDIVMKHKLLAKYNYDKEGSITYLVDWIRVVEELIEKREL